MKKPLMKYNQLLDAMRIVFSYWSSTFFIAGRPAALIFSFRTSHMWSSNSPRWNACRRSNDRAWYGSELLSPQKTFYQMQFYDSDMPLIDMSFPYLNIPYTITLEEFSLSSCAHCTSCFCRSPPDSQLCTVHPLHLCTSRLWAQGIWDKVNYHSCHEWDPWYICNIS